jgi:hypothetical protein
MRFTPLVHTFPRAVAYKIHRATQSRTTPPKTPLLGDSRALALGEPTRDPRRAALGIPQRHGPIASDESALMRRLPDSFPGNWSVTDSPRDPPEGALCQADSPKGAADQTKAPIRRHKRELL